MSTPENTPEVAAAESVANEAAPAESSASEPTETTSASPQTMSAFLPLVLMAVSLLFSLVWQLKNSSAQSDLLQQNITQRQQGVAQSRQLQSGLEKLVMDLIDAAKDDDDAKRVIAKYNIQMGGKPVAPLPPGQ